MKEGRGRRSERKERRKFMIITEAMRSGEGPVSVVTVLSWAAPSR
jgi:hypothetical protein